MAAREVYNRCLMRFSLRGGLRLSKGQEQMGELACERERLIEALRREVKNDRVLRAMAETPREVFMPPRLRRRAYDNEAFAIGYRQTISQPLMVALMLDALDAGPGDKVLDVGAGSGYQAAVLSRLARRVVSVERVPQLAELAQARLAALHVGNAVVHETPDTLGWPAEAPYDGIVVAASAPSAPSALLAQLREDGRLVIPLGPPHEQRLARITKTADGAEVRWLGACRFVPLLGPERWGG